MFDNTHDIDPQKLAFWDEEFKQYGIKVTPDTAPYYEIETFYPHHVVTDGYRVGFFKRDGSPFFEERTWYEVDPSNITLVLNRVQNLQPETIESDNLKGWLIPLRESTFAMSMEHVNAYLHNLMFWESVLPVNVCGPMMQRLSWMTGKLYALRGEQRDSIVIMGDRGLHDLSITTDSTREIVEYALGNRPDVTDKKDLGNKDRIPVETSNQMRVLMEKMMSLLNEASHGK